MVSTAAFHARVRGSVPGLGGLKETKNVSSPSTCEGQYCGEPPWPRGSVLGLRPPGLELLILCLEDSVISIISPSSGGSPGPVYLICAQRWPKARFISFFWCHILSFNIYNMSYLMCCWSCVYLARTTTSSGWKLLMFVSLDSKYLQILMFKHKFQSQLQWFDRLMKQILDDNSRVWRCTGYCIIPFHLVVNKGLYKHNIE